MERHTTRLKYTQLQDTYHHLTTRIIATTLNTQNTKVFSPPLYHLPWQSRFGLEANSVFTTGTICVLPLAAVHGFGEAYEFTTFFAS
jgi:hypothetical protein